MSTSKHRLLRKVLIFLFVLGAWELLALGLGRLLIVRTPLYHADAIVVLSGSSTFRERIAHAARLYKKGVAARIILTNDNQQGGWSNELERNPFFFERARTQLFEAGIPEDAVEVLLEPVTGTHDEAVLLQSYCERHNFDSLLIVTSPYHSRRARWTFNRVLGSRGIEIGIDPVEVDKNSVATWWLRPSGLKTVPLEYVKLLYYRVYF